MNNTFQSVCVCCVVYDWRLIDLIWKALFLVSFAMGWICYFFWFFWLLQFLPNMCTQSHTLRRIKNNWRLNENWLKMMGNRGKKDMQRKNCVCCYPLCRMRLFFFVYIFIYPICIINAIRVMIWYFIKAAYSCFRKENR